MPDAITQTYRNHRRYVPLYHFVAGPILMVNLVAAIVWSIQAPGFGTVLAACTAFALVLVFVFARMFANRVQDRVVRLEERLRLNDLLPEDLRGKVGSFTLPQLVGLRFAADAELPALARTVLEQNLQDADAIKRLVVNWRPDQMRT